MAGLLLATMHRRIEISVSWGLHWQDEVERSSVKWPPAWCNRCRTNEVARGGRTFRKLATKRFPCHTGISSARTYICSRSSYVGPIMETRPSLAYQLNMAAINKWQEIQNRLDFGSRISHVGAFRAWRMWFMIKAPVPDATVNSQQGTIQGQKSGYTPVYHTKT